MRRMNREEFFGRLATFDDQRLKKALWNLYWRGSAAVRERIEAELDPDQPGRRQRAAKEPVDPEWVLSEVRDFVALALGCVYGRRPAGVTARTDSLAIHLPAPGH